jgi:hypothetical protein
VIAFLLLSLIQTPHVDRVIPSFGEVPLMVAPGSLVSIYGSDLGPAEGCRGYGDQQHWDELPRDNPFHVWGRIVRYPAALCDVQVMIGDIPAGLLWVQAAQINFQVPPGVPFGGSAALRVIHGGVSSPADTLRFGIDRMAITQDEPALVGMPVWVRVHTAYDLERPLQFPFRPDPLWLPCEDIEVRRNGVALPRLTPKTPMERAIGGAICGHMGLPGKPAKAGLLPLHLFYRFDEPGAYEVRYTELDGPEQTVRERSEWATIHVLAPQRPRTEWLTQMAAHPPASAREMLSDYLPSLMGYGDEAALPLLLNALDFPDDTVRSFARYGMADYYDRRELFNWIVKLSRTRNLTPAIASFMDFLNPR